VAKPIEQNTQSLIGNCAIVCRWCGGSVNGRIIWADVFASTDLLEKYWPSWCALTRRAVSPRKEIDIQRGPAQFFLGDMEGRRE